MVKIIWLNKKVHLEHSMTLSVDRNVLTLHFEKHFSDIDLNINLLSILSNLLT